MPTLVTCTVHTATCLCTLCIVCHRLLFAQCTMLCTLCIVGQCLFQRLLLAGHPRTSVPPPKQLGLPAALPLLVTLHMCVLLIGASCVSLCVLLCCHLLVSNFRPSLSFGPPLSRSRPSGNKQWEKSSSIFVQAIAVTSSGRIMRWTGVACWAPSVALLITGNGKTWMM